MLLSELLSMNWESQEHEIQVSDRMPYNRSAKLSARIFPGASGHAVKSRDGIITGDGVEYSHRRCHV